MRSYFTFIHKQTPNTYLVFRFNSEIIWNSDEKAKVKSQSENSYE